MRRYLRRQSRQPVGRLPLSVRSRLLVRGDKKSRIHHAFALLKGKGLTGKPLKECVQALTGLQSQVEKAEAAESMFRELPAAFAKMGEKNPHSFKVYQSAKEKAERERYFVDVQLWRLIIELGKEQNGTINEAKGKKRTANVLISFNKSVVPTVTRT